jgi:hypothetical protein
LQNLVAFLGELRVFQARDSAIHAVAPDEGISVWGLVLAFTRQRRMIGRGLPVGEEVPLDD